MDITGARLRAQGLVGPGLGTAVGAVRALGAVQSQDFDGAKWALAMRSPGATEASIDALYDAGAIVRTHVLRPTWHFATAEDVRWLVELTGPRVRAGLVSRHRVLEVDAPTIARAESIFAAALEGGRHLTRRQLGEELTRGGIPNDGQRLAHLVLCAELDGLVVSGRRAGKQHTYALLEERVPQGRPLDRDEALRELAVRYFTSHGPAQIPDFVWWSGLTVAGAREAVALAGDELAAREVDGRDYLSAVRAEPATAAEQARLLPSWDEYSVAYRDRSAIEPALAYDPSFFSFQSILAPTVVLDGRVAGTWRWARGAADAVDVRMLRRLTSAEEDRVRDQVARLEAFRGRSVRLTISAG